MAEKKARSGKKTHKNKPTSKKYNKYKIEGDTIVREKMCPRCGPGIFLANMKNRVYCGKCHYTEFVSKENISNDKPKEEEKKE